MNDRLRQAIADFVALFPLQGRPMIHARLTALVEELIKELRGEDLQ